MTTQVDELNKVINQKITAASSSLTKLVLILDNQSGLELHGIGNPPAINISVRPSLELQEQSEAVCQVDWSWILSSEIERVTVKPSTVILHLKPAGDLTIDARLWQDSAFLSFMPWKPAKK